MADDSSLLMNGKLIKDLRVVDLKKELEKRGLPKTGAKSQLVERLKAQLLLEKMKEKPIGKDETVPNLELQENAENDFVKQYLAEQQKRYEVEKENKKKFEEEMRQSMSESESQESEAESPAKRPTLDESEKQESDNKEEREVGEKVLEGANEVIQPNDDVTEAKDDVTEAKDDVTENKEEQTSADSKEALNTTTATDDVKKEKTKENIQPITEDTKKDNQQSEKDEAMDVEESPAVDEGTNDKADPKPKPKPSTDDKEETLVDEKVSIESKPEDENLTVDDTKKLEEGSPELEKQEGRSRSRSRSVSTSSSKSSKASKSSRSSSPTSSRSRSVSRSISRSRSSSSSSSSDSDSEQPFKMKGTVTKAVTKTEQPSTQKAEEEVQDEVKVEENGVDIDMEVDAEPDDSSKTGQTSPRQEEQTMEEGADKGQVVKSKPVILPTRKIALKSRKSQGEERDSPTTEQSGEKKKRRWGMTKTKLSTEKPSVAISTDTLKEIIPEIKPGSLLQDSSQDDTEVGNEAKVIGQSGAEEFTITRMVTQDDSRDVEIHDDDNDEQLDYEDEKVEQDSKKLPEFDNKPDPALVRRVSRTHSTNLLPADEPEATRRSPSPARFPPNKIIHIRNLVRPFTVGQLKAVLGKTGTLVESDNAFWIDGIKSHCYAMYETEDMATESRQALHGKRWPHSNPKILDVDFASKDELEFHRDGGVGRLPRKRKESEKEKEKEKEKPKESKDSRRDDRKREEKSKELSQSEREERRKRRHTDEHEKENVKREEQRKHHVREWDRDKVRQSSSPERLKRRHSEDHSSDRRHSLDHSSDRRRDRERARKQEPEDEAPAKLLDDLFRKTKATPSIYWLPLTEEQIKTKEEERNKRKEEREKRKKEIDEKEDIERKEREAKRRKVSDGQRRSRSNSHGRGQDTRRR